MEPGDRIYTGQDGRAEIEFDDGSVFRLAENTDLEILSLNEDVIQVRLLLGLSTLTISGDADFEIDTPAAAFNPTRKGIYRFDVIENGDTDAIARSGELEAANNGFSRRIESGELLHVAGGDNGRPDLSQYDRRDQWDEWTDRRDADLKAYASRSYLPDTVYMGASDLDRYGRWVTVDTYGTAWVPFAVDAYWSPYSIGRWCYRPLFGWTWVSYEPWGWLPYHYGRWYRSMRFGWCWLPGPSFAFNFWSPGLVTFYSGPGWVSWCPLGPGDYYDINRYHFNRGIYSYQLGQLRALHTRAPGNPFNRDVGGAFRVAQIDQFRNGSFDARHRWENINQPWRQGSVVQDRLNIQPTSRSYFAAPDRPAVRPRMTSFAPVIVRHDPGIGQANPRGYTKITNPQIPAPPSRWRIRSEGNATEAGREPRSNSGVTQTPQRERMDQSTRNGSGSNAGSGDRNTNTFRGSGTTGNPGGNNQNQPRTPRWRRTTPEQTPQASPQAKPRAEDRQQNNYTGQQPATGGTVIDQGIKRPPMVSRGPIIMPPRQSNPSAEQKNSGVGSNPAPAPSYGKSGTSSTVRSGGISSGGSSNRGNGGGNGQKARENDSSGNGRKGR